LPQNIASLTLTFPKTQKHRGGVGALTSRTQKHIGGVGALTSRTQKHIGGVGALTSSVKTEGGLILNGVT